MSISKIRCMGKALEVVSAALYPIFSPQRFHFSIKSLNRFIHTTNNQEMPVIFSITHVGLNLNKKLYPEILSLRNPRLNI